MSDCEKVFKGLETCSQKTVLYVCGSCPYNNDDNDTYDCTQALSEDALKLLKEQQKQIEELEERLAIVLEGQPEIVRCKDCKHYRAENGECLRHHFIIYFSNGNWFCADRKRRDKLNENT